MIDPPGAKRWILTTKVPLRDDRNEIFGLAGISRDITERKLADAWRDGQARNPRDDRDERPAGGGARQLMRLVESQLTGISGSVLLLDEDGAHLRHGAAPSLPTAYTRAIDGVRIGPNVGSCGTAVYRRETVIVSDIMTRPAVGGFSRIGRGARPSLLLVDPDPVAPGRGARRLRALFEEVREPTRERDAPDRAAHPARRHRDRAQEGRRPHPFHGQS